MTAQRVHVEPDAFAALAGLAAAPPVVPAPAAAPAAEVADEVPGPAGPAARRGRTGPAVLAGAAVVVVVAGALVVPGLVVGPPATGRASVTALEVPQQPADVLHPEDVARLAVDAASTRLLVVTEAGSHYVARTPSGDLCLVRVPTGDLPTEVCVPDRVGADATIGTEGTGQVRLVADGAPPPEGADGWGPAGPNVWVRG